MRALFLALPVLLAAQWLNAATLTGTVKDPSGAVISGAALSAQPLPRGTALQATTDAQGRFRFEGAAAGSYNITVTKTGFEPWERKITLTANGLDLPVALKLKITTETVQVSGKRSVLANSDPNYIGLRNGKLTKVYRVENLTISRDVGSLTFRSGSFSFLPPVMGHVTAGVFVGEGNFQMTPAFEIAAKHLHRVAGVDRVEEDFTAMVVYFTDSTFDEVKQHAVMEDAAPQKHEEAFQRVKSVLERRMEPSSPLAGSVNALTLLQRLLNYEDIPNYEAEVLAEIYNSQLGSFRAFLHGKKHADLRFLVNPRGAMPMLPAPEEVALLNYDPGSDTDGIWYLSHRASEIQGGTASSSEEKRLVAPEHYDIQPYIRTQNLIGKQPDLAVTCDLRFHAVNDGTRMVKFDLLPDLQVSRVAWNGKEIPFIQESRKHDGSFYMQMPEVLEKGRSYQITFEYAGGEILQSDFGIPPARRVWYPTPNGKSSRATYNLTFHYPRGTVIVSVGKLVSEGREGPYDVAQWSTDTPIAQAVFRYLGNVFTKTSNEEVSHTELRAYVLGGRGTGGRAEAPPPGPQRVQVSTPGTPQAQNGVVTPPTAPWSVPRGPAAIRAPIQPSSPSDVLIDAGNAVRVFSSWYGPPAYHSLSVVVGPGSLESLPGLVYAPPVVMAGYGQVAARGGSPLMKTFLDEAFPREVSRQWWGNSVGPATFHDEWLSNGFANFSGSLYDLVANPKDFLDHWVRARDQLLHAPASPFYRSERRPNDGGPIWMGLLDSTSRTPGASGAIISLKGGYVLHMLRCMMWEPKTNDDDFRGLMQDYAKQFAGQTASTEDFKAMVEKHMKPVMDLDGNHTMDWFFGDWVYGTDIPSYRLDYSLTPDKDGKTVLTGKLTQSGVSPTFKMLVPIFGEFGMRDVRVQMIPVTGNASVDFKVLLPETPQRILLNLEHDVLTDKEEVIVVKGGA
jgi:Carboxypeptidase regulatory-like domain